jgi:mannitol-1-phosphate 5-dehydrogenase
MRGRFVSEKSAVIFGAGKTGRGFVAHLLTLSGYRITFVEKLPALVKLLRERASYNVRIMGSPEKDIEIAGFETLCTDEQERVARAIAATEVVFVSIGGGNLPQIAPLLAAGLRAAYSAGRTIPLNIILCENYFQPGQWLRALISEQLRDNERDWFHRCAGIVEALVLRSTVDPPEEAKAADPLSLNSQDTWEMPADREAFVGGIPAILWLAPKEGFQSGLIRKLYTYNSVNAVISYMGYMKGYAMLSEAANDPDIAEAAREAAREAGESLCAHFGFDPEDQRRFAAPAIAKFQNRDIVDPIERNARDPIRKLARDDRLVGPACLAIEHGIRPVALSRGIAAALRYNYPGDETARNLQELISEKGLNGALRQVCGIDPDGELAAMIREGFGNG